MRTEANANDETPAAPETAGTNKAADQPSPWVVDIGIYTSRRDRDAIQAEQDRWDRLERLGR